MPAVFISHSSLDTVFAAEIKAWLSELGYENVFLDFDKESGLGAGRDWARQLYDEVARCHVVVVIATPNWAASRWCFAEAQQALALGKVVLPIVSLQGQLRNLGPELDRTHAVVWDDSGRSMVAARLREIANEIARGYKWDGKRPPWPGIVSFDERDAAIFFGRDQEILDVVQRLEAKRSLGGAPLTLLAGASGSGKSSLLKAGVVPYLARDTANWWCLPPFRSGTDPTASLVGAFRNALVARGQSFHADTADPKDLVARLAVRLRQSVRPGTTILISIDQFEELFAIAAPDERKSFLSLLGGLLSDDAARPFLALATIRSDKLGDVLAGEGFALRHDTVTVSQMPSARLRVTIEGPARVAGITLQPGLVDSILADAAKLADGLPLIAFGMRDLYERRQGRSVIAVGDYEALGDPVRHLRPLENVVRRAAELALQARAVSDTEMLAVREAFVGSLVRIDHTGARSSRPSRMSDLPIAARPAIDTFIQARLLTVRGGSDEAQVVEVAHEALFRVWPQLTAWLDDEQDFLLGRRQIEDAREIWRQAPREAKDDALLSGLLLQRARLWGEHYPRRLESVSDFVHKSLHRDDTIRHRQRTIVRAAFAVVFVVAIILAGLTYWAVGERNRAENSAVAVAEQRDKGVAIRSLMLADLAKQRNTARDFGTSIALSLEALRDPYGEGTTASPEAQTELRHALWNLRERHVLPIGREQGTNVIEFSPDGSLLLTGSWDGVARLWNARSGELVKMMVGHTTSISALAFTRDGNLIATGDTSGGMRIWDGTSGELLRTLRPHEDLVTSLEFSKDGKRLLSASWDLTARISDPLQDGRPIDFRGSRGHLWSAQFSQDEMRVATAGEDGLRLYSAASGTMTQDLSDSHSQLMSLSVSPVSDDMMITTRWGLLIVLDGSGELERLRAEDIWVACTDCAQFSPDGSLIAAGSKGGVSIIDANTGELLRRTKSPDDGPSNYVHFSPDGQFVLSDEGNGSAVLNRVSDGTAVETFSGHTSFLSALAVSPDGEIFVTGSRDGTVRTWSADSVAGATHLPIPNSITWAAYSPDGATLAIAETSNEEGEWSTQGRIGFFGTADRNYAAASPIHHDYVTLGAFSPDSSRLVTVSEGDGVFQADGKQILEPPMVMLWGTSKHELVAQLQGHTDRVNDTIFSPDGKVLVTPSNDGTLRRWSASTGALIDTLRGHNGVVVSAVFSRDGSRLLSYSLDRTARLWDADGKPVAVLEGHGAAIRTAVFSPDGTKVATGSDDYDVRVWNAGDGSLFGTLSGHGGQISEVAFAGNDRVVSAASDGTVRVWGVNDLKSMLVSNKRGYNGGELGVSDDGTLISMSWGDDSVRVVSAQDAETVATITTEIPEQFQDFLPHSQTLLITSNYGTELFSLPSGAMVGRITLPFRQGQSYYISPTGERLALLDEKGVIDRALWLSPESLVATGQTWSRHDLSQDERYRRYLEQ